MYEYIPDYTDLFNEHEEEQEGKAERFPRCDCCGERITTDKFFNVDGTYICLDCINDYKVNTCGYMED